jgi:hypothetical protein
MSQILTSILSISLALWSLLVGAARGADNFDGEWVAVLSCTASKYNPVTFPRYSNQLVMTVQDGKLAGRRLTMMRPGSEVFTGDLRNGKLSVRGHGKFDGEERAWDTEYAGKIVSEDKVVFTGQMITQVGNLGQRPVRDCEIILSRNRPTESPAPAVAEKTPSDIGRAPSAAVEKPPSQQSSVPAQNYALPLAVDELGSRVALVIGNGAYVNANALPNPANDARAFATTLRQIGFDVSEGTDLDRAGMERLMRDFLQKASAARIALMFYAGHGMQVDGKNYLVPIDAKLAVPTDLAFETVEVDKVLDALNDPSRANIIILDACRDNPLARSFASRLGPARSTAVGAGLAAYSTVGSGTLIAYATAPGQVALDGKGSNSPFTAALIKHIRTPGLEMQQMLTRVRVDVATTTQYKQVPWVNSSLFGEVVLAR